MTEPLERTLSSRLAASIRERILTGEYAPGATLLQDSIALEFGVSKGPVREALVRLRSEGLVNIFAHRGFQVRPVSKEEMQEVFRLRLGIEPEAIAYGARFAGDADRKAVRIALAAEHEALTTRDAQSGEINRTFHLALIVPRLQPVTNEILGRLYTLSERYVRMQLQSAGRRKRCYVEHVELLDAWSAGHSREATRLVRTHIEQIRDDLEKALSAPR